MAEVTVTVRRLQLPCLWRLNLLRLDVIGDAIELNLRLAQEARKHETLAFCDDVLSSANARKRVDLHLHLLLLNLVVQVRVDDLDLLVFEGVVEHRWECLVTSLR